MSEIIRVIREKEYLDRLIEGCRKARMVYTIENMAARFAEGICRALSQ